MFIRRTILLSLALGGFAFAQNPPIPGLPGVPGGLPEAEEGDPIPQNLTQVLKKPDPNSPFPSGLEFPNIDGHGIASLYQSATGKRVLVSSAVKDAQFSFIQSGGMTNGEVAELLEKFLLMEGYQLNPDQRNPDIISFVAANQPGGPASTVEPIKVLTDSSQLALETGIVAYVMKFEYLKPEEAQRAFTQVYGQFRPGGTIAEVRNASSLIITEKAPLIQSLLKLKAEIDVPSAQVATDWVEVQYADVQELADQLNEMFNAQSTTTAGVQRQQPNRPNNTPVIPGVTAPPTANNPNGGGGAAGEENPPTITPDTRTNRIFLMGRPVDLVFIKELISQWDVKTSDRNFLRRRLKYLPIFEFLPIAERAINSTMGSSAAAAGGGAAGGNRNTGNANNGNQGNNNNNGNNGNNTGTGGVSGGIGNATLSGSDRPTEPESVLIGNTLLVSDNVSNSIIVQGAPHHIELVERMIEQLDVKSEQVAIEAVFARFGVVDNLSFGVNLAQLLEGNGIAAQTLAGAGFIDPSVISDFASVVTGAFNGGLNVQGISGDFGVFVQALETYTNFRSFSRPTVFTTNNKEARISSGRQIAITTESSGANFANVQTDFRDVGLELLVRPLVNSTDEITLEIAVVQETVAGESSVDNEDIPDFLSDQLTTTVTVPNGAAVLLGGLIDDSESSADSGVPILKSIPLIGRLFKEDLDSFARNELVIMIRPTIVDGQVQLNQYQAVYDHTSNISAETRKQFSAPKYGERRNSAVRKIIPSAPARAPQTQPSSNQAATERMPTSPLQKAIYDKKKRAAAK